MFGFIKGLFEKRMNLPSLVAAIDNVKNIVDVVEKEYEKDQNAKEAVYDALIQLLQEKRDSLNGKEEVHQRSDQEAGSAT